QGHGHGSVDIMLITFLATDVEIWPRKGPLSGRAFREEFDRFIYGRTPKGDFGLPFQLEMLKEYDLKGVFLVDALFASVFGVEYLREITDLILDAKQEVQLHIHTEWVEKCDNLLGAGKRGRNIRDFSLDDQERIICEALDNMRACGLDSLRAFRAGNFGANWDTLRALGRNDILYDTSYNIPYLGTTCDLATEPPLCQPRKYGKVFEFPISFFEQGTGSYRHVQVGSCSYSELSCMLMQAWEKGWHSFQILCHNFECLNKAKTQPDPIVVRRYEKLCGFFADHRDRFLTSWFADLVPDEIPVDIDTDVLKSNLFRTALRYGEQLTRRIIT
ncbi:MAG: hypothetical protein ABIK28_22015, partial [Planctomycetota bacterium]